MVFEFVCFFQLFCQFRYGIDCWESLPTYRRRKIILISISQEQVRQFPAVNKFRHLILRTESAYNLSQGHIKKISHSATSSVNDWSRKDIAKMKTYEHIRCLVDSCSAGHKSSNRVEVSLYSQRYISACQMNSLECVDPAAWTQGYLNILSDSSLLSWYRSWSWGWKLSWIHRATKGQDTLLFLI